MRLMDKTESKIELLEQDFAQLVREHKGTAAQIHGYIASA